MSKFPPAQPKAGTPQRKTPVVSGKKPAPVKPMPPAPANPFASAKKGGRKC